MNNPAPSTPTLHPIANDPLVPAVLVTGATGAVGPLVVASLCQAGYQVHVLSRRPPPPGLLPTGVMLHEGDITRADSVRQAMAGCQSVVHMAALLHLLNPAPTLALEYERVNVQGTANVVQAALAQGVQRLLFFSTIAVYGSSQGQVLHESSPLRPQTYYAQSKCQAEALVLAARRKDGAPLGTVLRLAAVYGARVKGNYQRLLQALARGRFVAIGPGNNRRTLIHEHDVATATLLALAHPGAGGQIYNVTDGHWLPFREILSIMARAAGRPPPRFTLPVRPVRWAVSWVEQGFGRLGRQSPITSSSLDKYLEDMAVDGQRLRQELGFQPQFDPERGWLEVVTRLRSAGSQPALADRLTGF